ncbi:MAG: DoxX family protein [Mucilaginibacter sp.]
MKPLAVLLIVFCIVMPITRVTGGSWDYVLAGNMAMAAMLLFTAAGHFMYGEGLAMMVPEFIPAKRSLIYLTGIIEIIFAIGLLIPDARRLAADLLILFLLLILPANVNAAQKSVNYQKATYEGHGPGYLWLRIPMQVFFILWVAYFGMIVKY